MSSSVFPVLPGQTLGILGSGQLGRMTAIAAKQMGFRVAVLGPGKDDPAAQVADSVIEAPLDDVGAGLRLAEASSVVTLEFENVASPVARAMEERVPVLPGPQVLEIAQHRLREKESLQRIGAPTAPFLPARSLNELSKALRHLGTPAVVKTARGGYDGKGQAVVRHPGEAAQVYERLRSGTAEFIVEGFVPFAKELSVIVARGQGGESAAFPVVENEHRNGILHRSIAPARVPEEVRAEAVRLACEIARGLGVVGLLAVEMFYVEPGRLLVNELAPRPHNSGHYTLDACITSQFEQHVRAVCGLPLGSPKQHSAAVMLNLLGEHIDALRRNLRALLQEPGVKLHLYGKREARPGRKMGHLTVIGTCLDEVLQQAGRAWRLIGAG